MVLRLLKLQSQFRPWEEAIFAFAIGFGILGWLLFPMGISGLLGKGWLLVLLASGLPGLVLLRRPEPYKGGLDNVGKGLLLLIGVVTVFDIAEAWAPPTDADSLAYHFNAIKQFLAAGRIEFILRPLDGAIPYLIQMTYLPVLALGGEIALTFWILISGGVTAALLFILCRRHLSHNWSLCVTLIFLTTPVVIYAAGTGQVEIRMAMFVLVAAWAIAQAIQTGENRYAVLAGLAVGFIFGAKYTGLLFALAAGLTILLQRRWLSHSLILVAVSMVAGSQWYLWNAVHTGDPFFPMFFQWFGFDDLTLWTKSHDLDFKAHYFPHELPAPRNFGWFVLYPFAATLNPFPKFESGLTGFGSFGLILLPFAIGGLWKWRRRLHNGPLPVYTLLTLLFYGFWFFIASSQRIRFILPVLPLFLICFTVAAQRFAGQTSYKAPLIAGVSVVMALQLAAAGLFSIKYLRYSLSGETRQDFVENYVTKFSSVPWINANLSKQDKILISDRQLHYYFNVPTFFVGSYSQAVISYYGRERSPKIMYDQLASLGITHLLLSTPLGATDQIYPKPFGTLHRQDCFLTLKSIPVRSIKSRTLSGRTSPNILAHILKLRPRNCLQ
ncbi:MAG: hypothetical protein HOB79_15360 [Rhodospirillaceae bacterium]|jgi:hypothetical protein|nr:hypothetical protein [Rhodospirillales bacterium]MBT3905133.1 hypothetical protein [Rhodospirillaceae bacterium]MBT4702446.1 hypothetical protein [Rhodospirillaceae bacterium]MBT5034834.1 hypothetical protein [Rhodospirillaceae bacterium]MBT6219697.1 hypothetical protein [Rhodospirillaceae bacterium]